METRNPHTEMGLSEADLVLAQNYAETFVAAFAPGRIVLADLERRFGCNPFAPGDSHQTAFNCGTLYVLQVIGQEIEIAARPQTIENRTPEQVTTDG